jgi:SpoVK/Ycf46/Vps4 family AAA+-type ATPase
MTEPQQAPGAEPLLAAADLLEWSARVLGAAVERGRNGAVPAAPAEALRGLVLTADGVGGALATAPDALAVIAEPPPLPTELASALSRAGGDAVDAVVVGLALAVELDPRAGRAIAYLEDDVARKRPTVDLLGRLCCPTVADRMALVARLRRDGALAQRGLIVLANDQPAAEVRPGPVVVRHALGAAEPAGAIAPAFTPARPLPVGGHDPAVGGWAVDPDATVLHVHGADADVLAGRVAAALAAAGEPAALVDLERLDPADAPLVAAECLLRGLPALLVLPPGGHPALPALLRSIDAVCVVDPSLALLAEPGTAALRPAVSVQLNCLSTAERAAAVADGVERRGLALAVAADALPFARRYGLGPHGIDRVVTAAGLKARAAGRSEVGATDLVEAAAALAGAPLRDLATRVQRRAGWRDLAVPDPVLDQLRELCRRVDVRERVLDEWGFGETVADARGVSALFAGPSGTGKTLAASVVAGELGLALYRVELAQVVSKYIGETERNLDAVFAAAESTDVVLLFDEADALFGRRSEVQDAHDRYANLEVAYLLQRMEAYEGVAILSTNLLRNLDDAFTRRLDFRVHFPFPSEDERRRIWRLVWPAALALEDDVDVDALAHRHELAGGTIRNSALAAAHLAAAEGSAVGRRHIEHAIAREHEKLGRLPRIPTAAYA